MKTRVVVVVAAIVASSAALAYRPPGRMLLQKAMEKQIERGTRTIKVEAESQAFESGAAKGLPVAERMQFQTPGSARREIDLPEGTRTEIRVDDKLIVRVNGQADAKQKSPIDLLVDHVATGPGLDEDRAVERLLKDMKALGVNPEVVTFARWDGRVAYLIGSKAWETDKPQVWLDKDTLLPVRVVMLPKEGPVRRTDVRYLGWGSSIGGNWFPSTIEVWSDERLVRRSLVRSVERNVSFDATTFK